MANRGSCEQLERIAWYTSNPYRISLESNLPPSRPSVAHWLHTLRATKDISVSSAGNEEADERGIGKRHNPLNCQRVASPVISSHQRGRRDSNPQPPDRQFKLARFVYQPKPISADAFPCHS